MSKQNEHRAAVRNYKDSVFRMIFSDKKELLALYNALNGSHYTDPEILTIKTLENAIYMNIKNDLSFLLHDGLYLYEHQSTFNPNMPLRDLFYVADEFQEIIRMEDLYKSTKVKIPTPEFVTFYNGKQKQPERKLLKLSDAFEKRVERPGMELIVTMLNINAGCNKELMEQCRTLRDYALYVEKVRSYSQTMETDEAVEKAVTECIKDDILKEFLLRQRAEAVKVTIYEFDQEQHNQTLREEGYVEGHAEGLAEGREKGIEILIRTCKKHNATKEEILSSLREEYGYGTDEEAMEKINLYW
ncbi:MAG: hypothetical protein LUG83_09405 [Lachnospiraceae bacterium]|nr:hypothetical protein [Lachnospiraceae bacterium]